MTAANLGVAPELYDAWYVRHKKPKQKAGLYLIQEHFDCDMQNAILEYSEEVMSNMYEIERQIHSHIEKLANNEMFCYDLKPGNIVLNINKPVVKFIDFGREFCEQNPWDCNNTERVPVTSYIKKLSLLHTEDDEEACKLYKHLLYITMMVILSANTTYFIHSVKEKTNSDKELRYQLNYIVSKTKDVLENTRGKVIKIVREILRQEDIKSVISHYMSRRNSSTKRVFKWADGTNI